MEADVDRLDINECIKQFGLNNSNSKLRDLDIDKMKAVTIDMKHWSHVVDKKVLKNTKSKKLNTKVNNLEKNHDTSTLIQKNQSSTGKKDLEKKTG